MWIRVDAQAPEPLFAQIVTQVKASVARGELTGGAKLPSVRELARELSINPNTVVKAYRELEGLGLVVRRQGSGCFVTERPSGQADVDRDAHLDELFQRAATDAFHLGLSADEMRRALERALDTLAFPKPQPAPDSSDPAEER